MKIFLAAAIALFSLYPVLAQTTDAALRRVTDSDKATRDASGKLPTQSAAEHLSRAETYMANRLFPQAREHWAIVLSNYPTDAGIPKALFGTARSYMWEREYAKAVEWFDKLTNDYLMTKDGREGLSFKGASYVRMGKNLEAVKAYEQYTVMFPQGERIESAHLNIIDAYREAGKYDDANRWVDKSVQQFSGKPTEVNALQARLRMEIFRGNWNAAVAAADRLLTEKNFAGSMASADEIKYLKAVALDKAGKRAEADTAYSAISPSRSSYYYGLASDKQRTSNVRSTVQTSAADYGNYPILFRDTLLQHSRSKKIDPRFVLAIMKQESSFKAGAKSPAGARGLLQLVYDTALKYSKKSNNPNLQPDDLYSPATNIAIGTEYIRVLKDEFGGLYEGIAASYNGGEDNALRWLQRSKPREAGIFAAEIGFAESKSYVFKVMNNYRIYRDLYTEDLVRR
ncbi:MAG TPA: transglycosylase SLT domain-containing protein [Pyrinomonadaceae bacterium]|nr:transglycosylase SLT domain-containing protein [Pyrinomonadaceae bacterium]